MENVANNVSVVYETMNVIYELVSKEWATPVQRKDILYRRLVIYAAHNRRKRKVEPS